MPRSFAPPNAGAGSGSPSSSSVNSGQSKRRSIKISPRAMRRPPLRPNRIYPAASGLDPLIFRLIQFLSKITRRGPLFDGTHGRMINSKEDTSVRATAWIKRELGHLSDLPREVIQV